MSTTVKQSVYKEVKEMYERKCEEVLEVNSMVLEAENEVDEDILYEMHTEIDERLNDLLPDLRKLKEKLTFIVDHTNTTAKAKVKYVEYLEDVESNIKYFEDIEDDIGFS